MKIRVRFDGLLLIVGFILSDDIFIIISGIICATVHELGHIFFARTLKIKLERLEIGLFGARIYPSRTLSYKEEFIVCSGGPLFGILFSFIIFLLLYIYGGEDLSFICDKLYDVSGVIGEGNTTLSLLPYICIIISLMQSFINLLPVEGLDGGRMTMAVISILGGVYIARRVECIMSICTALFLWIISVYLLIKTGSGLGIFIASVCFFAKITEKDGT